MGLMSQNFFCVMNCLNHACLRLLLFSFSMVKIFCFIFHNLNCVITGGEFQYI